MKRFLTSLALVALTMTASVAQAGPANSPSAGTCSVTDITGAIGCVGGFPGNDLGTPANVLSIGTQFANMVGEGFDPFELIDNSNGTRGTQVALIYDTGGKTGRLLIEDPTFFLKDFIFGISLKAGDFYSLYTFDGGFLTDDGVMNNIAPGFTSLEFTTAGTGNNWKGVPLGLSHAALWAGAPTNFGGSCGLGNDEICTPIPEPSSLALMFAGLGAIGFVAHRRKSAKVVKSVE